MLVAKLIRARIEVEPLTASLVCVRERRGNRVEIENFAVWTGAAWCWDASGHRVDTAVDDAIRKARASSGIEPPS